MKFLLIAVALLFGMAASAHACTNPAGVEGDMTFINNHGVPIYCDGTNWIAMTAGDPNASGNYRPNSVLYDGTNDYLTLGSGLSGVVDGKTLTVSFWAKMDAITVGSCNDVWDSAPNRFRITYCESGTDTMDFIVRDTAGAVAAQIACGPDPHTTGVWRHYLMSLDVANPANNHCYTNDVSDKQVYGAITNTTLDFTLSSHTFGSRSGGGQNFQGEIADFWLDTGTYIDFSVEANRRKFIDANGNPVFLGTDGSLPTGSPPDIFLSGDTSIWHTNKGTGGGFTEVGALTDGATSPYVARTQVVPSGLVAHWRLDETSGTTAYDSSGNGHHGTYTVDASTMNTQGVVGGRGCGASTGLVSIPDHNDFDVPPGEIMTITFWVHNVDNGNVYISKRTSSPYKGYTFQTDGVANRIQGRHFIGDGINNFGPNATGKFGQWDHLACTIDGVANTIRCYTNGSNSTSRSLVGDVSNTVPLELCNIDNDARMDDVRVYRRVLTVAEIQEIMAARDGIRYNANQRTMEYFDQNRWVSMTPAWPDVTTGLLYHYKLDEVTGTTALDSSGNGADGTYNNITTSTASSPGAVGRAMQMDRTSMDGSITLAANSALLASRKLTLAAWVNLVGTAPGYGPILENGGHFGLNTGFYTTQLEFHALGWSTVGSWFGPNLSLDRWHHVAVTYDYDLPVGTAPTMYVDGTAVSTSVGVAVSGTFITPTGTPFYIGRRYNSSQSSLNGALDDVRIYDRILSATEIQMLFNMGTPIGSSTALPQGCPNIGDVCDDGTVYAGLQGGERLFFSPYRQSGSEQWKNATGTNDIANDSSADGRINHRWRFGALSSFPAFDLCQNLELVYPARAYKYTDWYLPSIDEIDYMKTNMAAINRNIPAGSNQLSGSTDWSSTEFSTTQANVISGAPFTSNKNTSTIDVWCIRRGPAPRCANPYGIEGAVTYNLSFDVLQFCDGARWIAIGKSGP